MSNVYELALHPFVIYAPHALPTLCVPSSIPILSSSFLYHPYIPFLIRRIFNLLVIIRNSSISDEESMVSLRSFQSSSCNKFCCGHNLCIIFSIEYTDRKQTNLLLHFLQFKIFSCHFI